jgi:hypothetical protein
VDLLTHQLAEGRPMRGLYPTDVLGDPARLAYVRQWSDAGEDVRLMSQTLPSLAVSGPRSRWCPRPGAARPAGTCLVGAGLVALARELFEQYWRHRGPACRLPAGGRRRRPPVRADLLRLGLKTKASPGTSGHRCGPSGGGSRR